MKLDALVIQKRLSCDDDCSYQVRLKRYREQRQNLGELNRLARVRPRPVFTPTSPTVLPKVVDVKATSPTRPTVEEDIEADDEWFELSRKRMFEGDGVAAAPFILVADLHGEPRHKNSLQTQLHCVFYGRALLCAREGEGARQPKPGVDAVQRRRSAQALPRLCRCVPLLDAVERRPHHGHF